MSRPSSRTPVKNNDAVVLAFGTPIEGVEGALTLSDGIGTTLNTLDKSDRRFSLPLQVDLLEVSPGTELVLVRVRSGRDSGRLGEGGKKVVKEDDERSIGDGGAYISDNCDSSEGEVNADSRFRTLSHWVWVVYRVEWRTIWRGEDGESVVVVGLH